MSITWPQSRDGCTLGYDRWLHRACSRQGRLLDRFLFLIFNVCIPA